MNRFGTWSQTFTGRKYYPYDPRPEDFCIKDIAHALSLLCRFNGHCGSFYSVAQHSIIMSMKAPPKLAMWALFHDAAEAYVGDLIRPVKAGGIGRHFRKIELNTLKVISEKFDLGWPVPDEIHVLDNRMLATEARDLMGGQLEPWSLDGAEPYNQVIDPLPPSAAEKLFLSRYNELTVQ